jgi:hypothetical protein
MDWSGLVFCVIGFATAMLFWEYVKYSREKAFRKYVENAPIPIFLEGNPPNACPNSNKLHQWESFEVMDALKGEAHTLPVCIKCGQIGVLNKRFSPAGLANIIHQKNYLREREMLRIQQVEEEYARHLQLIEPAVRQNYSLAQQEILKSFFHAGFHNHAEIEATVQRKLEERAKAVPGVQTRE